jgi:DNA-binding response OmpR family regulator
MKAVVFEDNPNIQVLLKYFFQKRGITAHIAGDAVDAVAVVQAQQPDIVIMDIIMPGKSGIEACGDLRAAGIKTPVVFLTSKDYEEDKEFARKAGADAYLLKPFNSAQLDAVITPLLKKP